MSNPILSTPSLALRHIIHHPPLLPRLLHLQRRHARVHDVRFVTTQQPAPSIHEKYRQKLEKKAREEGLQSVAQLKEVYRGKIEETRRRSFELLQEGQEGLRDDVIGGGGDALGGKGKESGLRQHPPPPPPVPQSQVQSQAQVQSQVQDRPRLSETKNNSKDGKASETGIKSLSSYLDLQKVSSLSAKEIEYIWRLRHANDSLSLCAMIPLATYQRIYDTAKWHPQFILPLPRPSADDGSGDIKQSAEGFTGGERTAADVHFLQWGFHPPAESKGSEAQTANTHTSTVIFTSLAAYKLHGAYAQPHTTITHHLDLADSHGIVLLNGSVVDGAGVSVEEGRWLLMCLQKFYDVEGHGRGVGKEKRQGLLEKFSKGDKGFSLEELVDEAERIS